MMVNVSFISIGIGYWSLHNMFCCRWCFTLNTFYNLSRYEWNRISGYDYSTFLYEFSDWLRKYIYSPSSLTGWCSLVSRSYPRYAYCPRAPCQSVCSFQTSSTSAAGRLRWKTRCYICKHQHLKHGQQVRCNEKHDVVSVNINSMGCWQVAKKTRCYICKHQHHQHRQHLSWDEKHDVISVNINIISMGLR